MSLIHYRQVHGIDIGQLGQCWIDNETWDPIR